MTVNPSDVIILEGILVLHDPRVRDLMNMKIFVDTVQILMCGSHGGYNVILFREAETFKVFLTKQRVFVIGGGGAVGFAAIQLSVAAGCQVSTTCGRQSIDRVLAAGAVQAIDYTSEDIELAIKGKFDAVLDTIGGPETERMGINFLNKGGHYMTPQGDAAFLADKYGLTIGLPAATTILLKKQFQYQYSHGIEHA